MLLQNMQLSGGQFNLLLDGDLGWLSSEFDSTFGH